MSLLTEATNHVRAAFAQKGRAVDVEDSFGGVTLVEGEHREFFEYPTAVALEEFGVRERWLGSLVAVFTARTMRVGSKRR